MGGIQLRMALFRVAREIENLGVNWSDSGTDRTVSVLRSKALPISRNLRSDLKHDAAAVHSRTAIALADVSMRTVLKTGG